MPACIDRWEAVRGGLIVSCQASEGDAFFGPGMMARFAKAALDGGAAGIRANGSDDIREIRAITGVPIIGIQKSIAEDGRILITRSFEEAASLARAGADAIAIDCTERGCRYGALDRLRRVRAELGKAAMADIATMEEAEAAAAAGADFVLPTMRGYTDATRHIVRFDAEFIRALRRRVAVPVIAEGKIGTPEEARAALEAGAFAVVVGTAITRPHEITRRFVRSIAASSRVQWIGAVDLGASNIKWGLVRSDGAITARGSIPTSAGEGREAVIGRLLEAARCAAEAAAHAGVSLDAFGVASAGWVNAEDGSVRFATANLPAWAGVPVARLVHEAVRVPVTVDNDAIAATAGEWLFGTARGLSNFLCLTLGTGIGGGAVVEGRLLRGTHGLAGMLGHIRIRPGGSACTCGLHGCVEAYAGSRGLKRLTLPVFATAEEWIAAANSGGGQALRIMEEFGGLLADALAPAIQILDPEAIILSGGMAESNRTLPQFLSAALATRVLAPHLRGLKISVSKLGSYAGVAGAAALALDRQLCG